MMDIIFVLTLGLLGFAWLLEGAQAIRDWRMVRREREMLDYELDMLR